MINRLKHLILGALLVCLVACGTTHVVPITGRKQNLLVSDEQVLSLSNTSFKEYMSTAKISANSSNSAMVERVGKKLATAVENYLRTNGMADDLKNYSWEFHLVQDETANAFCMPGGKIVVNEGILPYTKDETGLAIVLSHEIAHAVAKHSAERMSQQMKAQYGAQALSILLSGKSQATQTIAQQVYGLGAQYGVMLPYSRRDEYEADQIGLIFAAMAGYNPQLATEFWQRMSSGGGSSVPEFMSTHPSDANRIANIQKVIPQALQYYTPAKTTTTTTKKATTTKKTTTKK